MTKLRVKALHEGQIRKYGPCEYEYEIKAKGFK